jgi:hypothetical protein
MNLTFYLVSGSDDWFHSLRERIEVEGKCTLSQRISGALTASPFMIHAIMSMISFEQSINYVAAVRERLMSQVSSNLNCIIEPGVKNEQMQLTSVYFVLIRSRWSTTTPTKIRPGPMGARRATGGAR